MEDSIFTKIIKGEIPSHKIYEDESTFAFLDIYPKTAGHTLVIPKKQVQFVWDMEEEDYLNLMLAVKKVAARINEVMGKPYIGEMIAGNDVPHAHIHVFPFSDSYEFNRRPDTSIEPDHAALAEVAKKLMF